MSTSSSLQNVINHYDPSYFYSQPLFFITSPLVAIIQITSQPFQQMISKRALTKSLTSSFPPFVSSAQHIQQVRPPSPPKSLIVKSSSLITLNQLTYHGLVSFPLYSYIKIKINQLKLQHFP